MGWEFIDSFPQARTLEPNTLPRGLLFGPISDRARREFVPQTVKNVKASPA
jgi:hypothetical protein